MKTTTNISKIIKTLIMAIISFSMLYPFVWMVAASFTEESQIFNFPFKLIPSPLYLQGYKEIFTQTTLGLPLSIYFFNTLKVSVIGTIGAVISCSLSAYGFSKIRFPGKDKIFLVMLATMMVPVQVTMLPNFIIYRFFGLVDTHAALWLYFLSGPVFSTFFMRQYFLTLPPELNESASIDGASHFRVFWQIIMPLAKPAIATITILNFIALWNSYDYALIYLRTPRLYTMPIALKLIAGDRDFIRYAGVMAGSVISMIPIVIIFISAQKYFVQGISMTGIKG